MEEKIELHADGISLNGHLHLPDVSNPPVVIGAHGLLSTGDSPKQQALAKRLNACGIAYLRFDHRGCGESQGDFSRVTTFAGRCADLNSAISYALEHEAIGNRMGLFGSSLGGAICLAVAGGLDIVTMVTLAAPVRLTSIRVPLSIETDPAFSGMKPEQLTFDVSGQLDRIKNILVVHGDADRIVPIENAEEIIGHAKAPKEFLCLKGADHPLSDPRHQDEFMSRTVSWFAERLGNFRPLPFSTGT